MDSGGVGDLEPARHVDRRSEGLASVRNPSPFSTLSFWMRLLLASGFIPVEAVFGISTFAIHFIDLDSVSASKVASVLHSVARDPERPTVVIASRWLRALAGTFFSRNCVPSRIRCRGSFIRYG